MKVVKYQDELEAGRRSRKPRMSISEQVEAYRQKILAKVCSEINMYLVFQKPKFTMSLLTRRMDVPDWIQTCPCPKSVSYKFYIAYYFEQNFWGSFNRNQTKLLNYIHFHQV